MPLLITHALKEGDSAVSSTAELKKGNEVSHELQALKEYLSAENKGGVLAIRTTSSGQQEMYRMQWYHRLWFCKTGVEQQKAAVNYVFGILSNSPIQQEVNKSKGASSPIISKALAEFLNPPSLGYRELSSFLFPPENRIPSQTTSTVAPLLQAQRIKSQPRKDSGMEPYKENIRSFLKSQNITIQDQIGEGAQAGIFLITYQGNEHAYLYKELGNAIEISKPNDLQGHRFDRISGDIAASQCSLPNVVESVGFFLQIESSQVDYHYVPNTSPKQIEEYAEQLKQDYSNAKIYFCGQIMKRAPGENLNTLITKKEIDIAPNNKPFKNIVYGLYSFLQGARHNHYVHYDIKPENLMFDKSTGQLTVIDTTSGVKLINDEEATVRGSSDSPSTNEKHRSTESRDITLQYAHPFSMFSNESANEAGQPGIEFDCFSTAMTLLHLVSKDDFEKYKIAKFPQNQHKVASSIQLAQAWGTDPKQYLENYLSWIKSGDGSESETAKILNANSDFKACLQLLFETSAAGEAGEAVFEQLATDPYILSCAEVSPSITPVV